MQESFFHPKQRRAGQAIQGEMLVRGVAFGCLMPAIVPYSVNFNPGLLETKLAFILSCTHPNVVDHELRGTQFSRMPTLPALENAGLPLGATFMIYYSLLQRTSWLA